MTTKEQLIVKLYQGTCSRQELESLLDLIQDDEGEEYERVMAKLWQELRSYPETEPSVASAMMQEMFRRVEAQENQTSPGASVKRLKRRPLRRRQLLQLTGAAVLLLLAGAFSWLWLNTEKLIVTQTAIAEQKTVALPDGSEVKLNANSTFSYHSDWDKSESRQVWLKGEAYFEVKKDQAGGRKFQVITEDLTVEVLGTIFNVNARETSTKVFLEEGKVSLDLEQGEENIVMEPGELVTYSKSADGPVKKRIEKEKPTSWKDGTAILTDALLDDIIQKVHELYEVKVVVEDKTQLEREFTVFLPVADPELGYQMLEGLGLELQKADKVWTIK